jgi:hypothetical protein
VAVQFDPSIFTPRKKKKKESITRPPNQPWYLDVLDFVLRPQRAITGALSNVTDSDRKTTFLGGLYGGISGKEKKDFNQVLNNIGWKQAERGEGYNFFKGKKGAFDLFDITSFAGDVVLDPITYITLGAGAATKAGVSAATKTAADIARKQGVELGKALTVKGQQREIQKMLDNIVAKKGGDNRVFRTVGKGEGARTIDEGIGKIGGVKAEASVNSDLIRRFYNKKIQDAMKTGRREGQNALVNIDIPFMRFYKSIGTKPGWLKVSDVAIDGKQLAAANRILEQLFLSEGDVRKIAELKAGRTKEGKKEIDAIMNRVKTTRDKFIEKAYGISDVRNMTLQEYKDMIQRLAKVRARDLPDSKITYYVTESLTGSPKFDVVAARKGYKSKFMKDYRIKGVPKATRKLLDELDYYMQIAETRKTPRTPATSGIPVFELKRIEEALAAAKSSKRKKAAVDESIRELIESVKKEIPFDVYVRNTTPTSRGSVSGLDLSRFVTDMGGASKLGSLIRRNNPFNIRTLRSQEESVNDVGNILRDNENRIMGRKREMEKQVLQLQKLAEELGVTTDDLRSLPYVIQKAFPDEFLDEDIATQIRNLSAELQLAEQEYKMLSKRKTRSAEQEDRMIDLGDYIFETKKVIDDLRETNKLSYKEALSRIADGDEIKIKNLELLANKMRNLFKTMRDEELKSGSLDSTRRDYFPHVIKYDDDKLKELRRIYKDDPEIGALITKATGNQFAKERKSFQTLAEVDNMIAILQERIRILNDLDAEENAGEVAKLMEKIDVISNLYERDPFTALAKRYYKSVKTTAMKDMQNYLISNGYIITHTRKKPLSESESDYFVSLDRNQAKALGLKEGNLVHAEVLKGLQRVREVFTDKGAENVLRGLEAFTNAFKTITTTIIPSHYWYNVIGLVTNNTMAGVGVESYFKAAKLLKAKRSGETLSKEEEKIIRDMLDNGVLNQTSYADLLGTNTAALERNDILAKIEKSIVDNPVTRFARGNIGDPMDNFFRVAHYLDVYEKTGSVKLASESVRKYLFNYSELTISDRAMKVAVPFWNWSKNNIPLQLHKLFTTPRFAGTYGKLREETQGDVADNPNAPDWLKSEYFRFGENAFYNPRAPIQDLATVSDLNKILGIQSPLIKVPQELAMNKQYFNQRPIDYEYQRTGNYDNTELAKYFMRQTGLTSRGMSTYEALQDKTDNKTILDNIRDLLIGKSVELKKQ